MAAVPLTFMLSGVSPDSGAFSPDAPSFVPSWPFCVFSALSVLPALWAGVGLSESCCAKAGVVKGASVTGGVGVADGASVAGSVGVAVGTSVAGGVGVAEGASVADGVGVSAGVRVGAGVAVPARSESEKGGDGGYIAEAELLFPVWVVVGVGSGALLVWVGGISTKVAWEAVWFMPSTLTGILTIDPA